MKKILIVVPSLNCGGVEKSLLNLLTTKEIDWNYYDVYIKNLSNEGIYKLPSNFVILENDIIEDYIFSPFLKSIKGLLRKGKYLLLLKRLFSAIIKYFIPFYQDQILWKMFNKNISCINEKYDIAIAYAEARSTYYVVDKVNSKTKYCWIHTDHKRAKFNLKFDSKYYKKIDKAICVSNYLNQQMKEIYPFLECETIYNIVPYNDIIKKSNEPLLDNELMSDKKNLFLSIGRISIEKGFDLAVKAAKILKEKNIDFCWYIVGDGNKRKSVEKLIKQYGLENEVIILGFKSNPYKFLKKCSLYIQPSRYEGFSTTVMESIVLSKKVVMTNVSGATEQKSIYDNVNICNISFNDIANEIMNSILKENIKFNYKNINLQSINQIKKILN